MCDEKTRIKLMKSLSEEQIKYLRNIAYNLINNKIKVSNKDKKKLHKYKNQFRILADVRKKKVKKQLVLAGKGFGILAPLLISLASSLGGKLFGKAIGV